MSPTGEVATAHPLVPASHAPAPHPHQPHTFLQAFQSLLYVIVVALFLITFTVQPFRIPSESMEPTLLVGDFLLVNKQVTSDATAASPGGILPASQIRRGELIVFHYPLDPSMHLVKRVIGLPGDHLRLREGRVFIDGHPLIEPYAVYRPAGNDSWRDDFPRTSSTDPGVDSQWWIRMHSLVAHGELTIPPGSYFVLGDNRNDSEDSRYWGLVPRAAIVGTPFLIYFSLNSSGFKPMLPHQLHSHNATESADAYAPNRTQDDQSRPGQASPVLPRFARWDRILQIIR